MPGTALNAINYENNEDTVAAIEEALNETSSMEQMPKQQPQQMPPQYQQPPAPQYQQPPPPPPQYQQMPQQMPQYQPPQYARENFEQGMQQPQIYQPAQIGFTFTIPDTLKKTVMLFIILLLLNNNSFKNVLAKIPMTVNGEGQYTFIMTLVISLIIATVFFITSSVF